MSDGVESIKGCLDQNQNQNCDPGEPSGDLRLEFDRRASYDIGTGRLIEAVSTHEVSTGGRFSGGVLTTRDIPVGNGDEIVSAYVGDLQVRAAKVDS